MAQHGAQRAMRAVAERQWGVVSFTQLIEAGFTVDEIRGMVRREQLLRVFHGVYALGHLRLTMRGRLHAAELAAGASAFLSHRTAAAERGLCAHPPAIELTVATGHTPPRRQGLRVHRTTIPTDRTQARPHHGLLVATVPRIIIDLARTARPGELQRLIRESIRTSRLDLAALHQAIDGHRSRPGTGLARAALRRYLPGSENRTSSLETQFQNDERGDPRLPTPLYNRGLYGYEIDVMWADRRVTLELDGRPYHIAVEDFDRDRGKDRTLTRQGWRPIRASDLEWEHDRARVVEGLYAVLGV